ncbi:MAG TPA: CHAT domain-containing protein [Candidatus Angelobacter sp.]|nr:CHAT domain-containing protein [Candidatus Angelobacter sp.]
MAESGGIDALKPWIVELSTTPTEDQRRSLLARQSKGPIEEVEELYKAVMQLLPVDLQRAHRLAEAAGWLAGASGDLRALAQSARAQAHVSYLQGQYRQAIAHYERSWENFKLLRDDFEVAITITSALQSLIYDGQYERAYALAADARTTLVALDNKLCLARLESNMGNIFYRQDRFQDAAEMYEKAYQNLLQIGEAQDVAAVLRNLAVCYISLNEFDRAQEMYELTRRHCERHNFPLLAARADYNVAYLYYLRGEYLRAIELYDATRRLCESLGDRYHQALCDLDESEIYLELNLTEGGEGLARAAFDGFTSLGLRYEAAKAAAFFGIAVSQQGHQPQAIAMFDRARDLFVKEQNQLWPALIDLYKAIVLYESDEDQAEELAVSALRFFDVSPLPAKAAICELLLATIALRVEDTEAARSYCNAALTRLVHLESPVTYQAYFVLGQVEESSGNTELARQAYEKAHHKLEDLRSHLGKEELKVAFLKNKLSVYESLFVTTLATNKGISGGHRAFQYVEQAKSRSLADLIAFRTSSFRARTTEHAAAVEQMRALREKLNWVYHQIELEELSPGQRSAEHIPNLRRQSREFEDALMKTFSEYQSIDQEFVGLQNAGTVPVQEMQAKLPSDALLVEYYSARNRLYACVVCQKQVRVFPLAEIGAVREQLRLLQLQLAKFRLGDQYARSFQRLGLDATNAHLQALHSLLIAPILKHLKASHLIIVPHGFLHYLPFHALLNGDRYLIDDFSISYAPSGSIFALCQEKPKPTSEDALVLAVPDPRAPEIVREAEFVSAALGNARLFLGEEAKEERLRFYGPTSRFIHIATHGYFRQDNPMFSSIRLGDSMLNLFDLYQLQLNAELVTLSGCGTGMNVVIGGDELIGLVRGLLYAGAQTLMVSLWEVHDQSTAELMRNFYRSCKRSDNKAEALRGAILCAREERPHPYYWAAFSLTGKLS